MPTAKEKFLMAPATVLGEQKKWAESLTGETACDAALLALVEEMTVDPRDLNTDAHSKLAGARRYRDLLLTIHKPQTEIKKGGLLGPNLKPPS